MAANSEYPVVLFDGVCNFCNDVVQFVIRRDPRGMFRFAPLQSNAGQRLLQQHGLVGQEEQANGPSATLDTFVLVDGEHCYTKSTAALHLFRLLGGGWRLFYVFIIVPQFIRDAVYTIIARNRYKWFGRKQECMLPSAEVRSRFLQ